MSERPNTTPYIHPQETHLLGLHYAMGYNSNGQPFIRTGEVDPANKYDAFGRMHVGQPYTMFDSQQRYSQSEDFWETTTGGGSTSYDINASLLNLTVDTADGSSVVSETNRAFAYQPGKSLEVTCSFNFAAPQTNLLQRVGYYNDSNGVFIEHDGTQLNIVMRSFTTGALVETRIPQTEWNNDKLDGTGVSKVTLDISKSQLFYCDIEWLGVGTVRVGVIIDGQFIMAHRFHHANVGTGTYMTTASLPIRYEIRNVGATAAPATLKKICATVVSNGGFSPQGGSHVISRGLAYTALTTAGAYYNVASIRLADTHLDDVVFPVSSTIMSDANANIEWMLVKNATFANGGGAGVPGPIPAGSWTPHHTGNVETSVYEDSVTDTGHVLASGFIVNKGDAMQFALSEAIKSQLTRTATADTFSLIAAADVANTGCTGAISWLEALHK